MEQNPKYNKPKTPNWIIGIGIVLILLGGCNLTSNVQSINMPELMGMQKKMVQNMTQKLDSMDSEASSDSTIVDSLSNNEVESFENLFSDIYEKYAMSEYAQTWIVRFGYTGMLLSIAFIISGVFLLLKKPYAIKLIYITLVLSILFNIVKFLIMYFDPSGNFISISMSMGYIWSTVIDIVIIIVVYSMSNRNRNQIQQIT